MSELDVKISECSNGSCVTGEKLLVYSTTVDTLSLIEAALGTFRGYEPVPGTMLQLELWGSANGTYITLNQTQNYRSKRVSARNCSLQCEVAKFLELTAEYRASQEELVTLCADSDYLLKLLTERIGTVLLSTLTVFVLFGILMYITRGASSSQLSLENEKSRWSKLLQDDDGF